MHSCLQWHIRQIKYTRFQCQAMCNMYNVFGKQTEEKLKQNKTAASIDTVSYTLKYKWIYWV